MWKNKQWFWKLIVTLVVVLLFFGGVGYVRSLIVAVGGVISVLLLLFALLKKKNFEFPKGFSVYSLFLILFGVSLIWSLEWQKSFVYLTGFTTGGLLWVSFYNLKRKMRFYLDKVVLLLGLLFSFFALVHKFLGFSPFGKVGLTLVSPSTFNHHHIGDFWVLVLVFVIYSALIKKKYIYILFFIPGIYFLLISLSRAAYLSLGVGVFSLFYYKGLISKYKTYTALIIFSVFALFLFAGTQKTTLFSRPYYLQALIGLVKYPLGVGYGNFGFLSSECLGCFGDRFISYSFLTHNIVLEILVGMGILGTSFIYWFYRVSKSLLDTLNDKSILPASAFFALLTNFLFDVTYVIPTMLWLFFIFLGMAQIERERNKKGMILIWVMALFLAMASLLISLGIIKPNLLV